MIARKCDRCGQLYEVPKPGELAGFTWLHGAEEEFDPGEVQYGKSYDLCADCTSELSDWMEGKEEKPIVDTRSAFERMTPEEYAVYLQETQPPKKPKFESIEEPVEEEPEPVEGESESVVEEAEPVEEEPTEAPQSETDEESEEIPEEPEKAAEAVADKPKEPENVTLGRKMAKDFFTAGMKRKMIAGKYKVNQKKVDNSLASFRKACPTEWMEIAAFGAKR